VLVFLSVVVVVVVVVSKNRGKLTLMRSRTGTSEPIAHERTSIRVVAVAWIRFESRRGARKAERKGGTEPDEFEFEIV